MAAPGQPPPPQRIFGTSTEERRRSLTVIGAQGYKVRDLYHSLLSASWTRVILSITAVYLGINALFGLGFMLTGGVANSDPRSFWDNFFFSVHTFATIGYGSMYPQNFAAEALMTVESLLSLFMNAMVTGLAFARFAKPTAKVTWSKIACVCDRDGVPTLVIRVANERLNHVVDAEMKMAVIRAETTKEGERVRRVIDLTLNRNSSPSFILTWLAMHPITKTSPLYGLTSEGIAQAEMEIVATLTGLDETLGQTIHSRTSYIPSEVRYGGRFVDVIGWLQEKGERKRVIDLTKFHDTQPAPLTREAMGYLRADWPSASNARRFPCRRALSNHEDFPKKARRLTPRSVHDVPSTRGCCSTGLDGWLRRNGQPDLERQRAAQGR